MQYFPFTGKSAHAVLPFTGSRFSIVFFTMDKYKATPTEVRSLLEGFGIPWPCGSSLARAIGVSTETLNGVADKASWSGITQVEANTTRDDLEVMSNQSVDESKAGAHRGRLYVHQHLEWWVEELKPSSFGRFQ